MKRPLFACLTTATVFTAVLCPFAAQALPPLPSPPSGDNSSIPSEAMSIEGIIEMMADVEQRLNLTDSQKSQFQAMGLEMLSNGDLFSPEQLQSMMATVQSGGSPFDAMGDMDLSPETIQQVGGQIMSYLMQAQSILTADQKAELREIMSEQMGDAPFPSR